MSGLPSNLPRRNTRVYCLGYEPSTKAVAGIIGRIAAGFFQSSFEDHADRVRRQSCLRDPSGAIDRAEYQSLNNSRSLYPAFECSNWTNRPTALRNSDVSSFSLLIGLALPNCDDNSVVRPSKSICSQLQSAPIDEMLHENLPTATRGLEYPAENCQTAQQSS